MKLSNLSVTARLALGFGALIAVLLVVAAVGTFLTHRQGDAVRHIFDVDVQGSLHILGARAEIGNLRRFEKDVLLNVGDRDAGRGYQERWRAASNRLQAHIAAIEPLLAAQPDREALQGLATALKRYQDGMEEMVLEIDKGAIKTTAEGYRRAAAFRDAGRTADHHMEVLFEASTKRADEIRPVLVRGEQQRQINVAVGVVLGLTLAAIIAFTIARSITAPIAYAVRVAEALARGDLTQNVEVRSKDELGRLMQALSGTVRQLGGIVGKIKEASDKVSAASSEIAQANLDLSTRTDEQASALEETSSSMQQISAAVAQNAQNARSANELSGQATGVAVRGGEVVRDAVGTMNAITESSKRIAEIIGVIDGIAFQTNILALNAAVEAARAGEQGRGFAVVASEVRSLAQRSAEAAKEIKTLITDSVSKVDAGSRQVNETGRTMEEILTSVSKMNDLVAQISKASEEQAQGIEQVTEGITQLEQVTQQNAAMVEQASAAAGSLEDESRSMSGAVGAFRLGGATAAALPAAARKAHAASAPRAEAQRKHSLPKRSEPKSLAPFQGEPGWQTF